MRRRWMIVAAVCLAVVATSWAGKKPFTIRDLYNIKSVSDPQISPDGAWIAFVVTSYKLEEGESNSEIYVMRSDGSEVRQMTNHPAADYSPRWSPDGKEILFISTRKDGAQLWMLPAFGGEPRQLTRISTGVSEPVWSPDGKKIAFASRVFPECGADDACNKKILDAMENGPIQAHLADELLYRHWTEWRDGRYTHILLLDVESGEIEDVTPGKFDSPPFALGGGPGFVFSPDGKELCFVSNHDRDQAVSTNKDLFLLSLDTREVRNITDENEAYDADPVYSPDGRYIAYRMQTIPGYESDRFRLVIYDRQTGTKRTLTEAFDYWVEEIEWSPDSRFIYFTAQVKGHIPLYRVNVRSGKIQQVLDVKTIDMFDLSPDGKWVAVARRSVGEPREIWRASTKGKNLKRLTFFNKAIEDTVDIRPAEEMWIPSPTGIRVHTFLVKPHNFDPTKKYPLILNVHGGPQSMWADAFRGDWQVYPGAGYIVAFPNPHGSVGYGQEITAEISKDWGGKVYEDIMAVADSLARLPYVDENRMGAMGWSYGGYMMMWIEGHTDRFKAIAAMMGVYDLRSMYGATEELWFPEWDLGGTPWTSDLYEKWSPSNFVKNFKTPCLVITGEKDYRVPYTQSLQFFTALQKMGVPSRLIVFKHDGHWPSWVRSMPLYYNAHLDWFHKYLGGDPPPWDVEKMVRNMAFEEEKEQ